jgi:hypothetical protein
MRNEITGGNFPPGGGLSEEQRLNRICELLSKAVMADWTERLVRENPINPATTETGAPNAESSDRQRILEYLALVGSATPSTIRATLDLPRMRLYRAVQPMLANGRLAASGRTSTITYSLAPGKGVDPGLN